MKRYEAYKDSGVDWIGEIPEEWELINFRQLINVLTDFTANGSFGDLAKNVTYVDQVSYSKLIRLTDLRKELNNDGVYIDEKSHRYLKKSELFGGEILIANVGAYAGLTCIMPSINYKASLGPNMFLLKFKDSLTIKYAFYLLNSSKYWEWLQITALSSAQPKLNKENIRQLKIVLPPLSEQTNIAKFLDDKTAKIDQTIGIKQKEIELLKERRQILIQQAVTKGLDATVPMKDSGVDWIGEIPEHWEIEKLKRVFFSKKKVTDVSLPCGSISYGKVVTKPDEKILEATKSTYQVLNRGEFLLNPLNLNYDLVSLRIALSDKDVVVSSGYLILKNKVEINKEYYKWFLHIFDIIFMKTLGAGVRQTLNYNQIGNSEILIPPISEQEIIALRLDRIEAKIAKAITLKEQEIEKLKEYKTVLIDNVVTGKVRVS